MSELHAAFRVQNVLELSSVHEADTHLRLEDKHLTFAFRQLLLANEGTRRDNTSPCNTGFTHNKRSRACDNDNVADIFFSDGKRGNANRRSSLSLILSLLNNLLFFCFVYNQFGSFCFVVLSFMIRKL